MTAAAGMPFTGDGVATEAAGRSRWAGEGQVWLWQQPLTWGPAMTVVPAAGSGGWAAAAAMMPDACGDGRMEQQQQVLCRPLAVGRSGSNMVCVIDRWRKTCGSGCGGRPLVAGRWDAFNVRRILSGGSGFCGTNWCRRAGEKQVWLWRPQAIGGEGAAAVVTSAAEEG